MGHSRGAERPSKPVKKAVISTKNPISIKLKSIFDKNHTPIFKKPGVLEGESSMIPK